MVTVILPCIVYIIWQDYLNSYFAYQYNQASTKLAFYFNEAVNNIKLAINYCHPGACQAAQKRVHFYVLITLKHKTVEKFVKNLFYGEKHSFIEWTYVVGAHWNCLYELF